jgi:TolB-like protein/DNA-binding winged helix-turn-helix (wHTH) protein/thioredoxin-like negative regulator of GroEL
MSEQSRPSYEFGPFSVDAGKRLLVCNGESVPLAPKVFEILLALIENRERVLTKDELLRQVWGDTSVEEGGLTRNVSILRKTLGEKPDDHQYIVTVPGRGYRFVAAVREAGGNVEPSDAHDPVSLESSSGPRAIIWARRWLVLSGLVALALGTFTYVLRPVRATGPGRPAITSLAVLPLENLSGDPTQDYFADGVTEALIGHLARIRALRVVSRTSVMRFKGTQKSLSEIARALNVDALIEGSVQRTGDRVKITVQLIHVQTDTHLWAREYERELTDVLKLQGEVARAVADEIRIQVTAEERARMAAAITVDPAAYQEYVVGRYHLWRYNEDNLKRAIAHFERATQIDPKYAAAYAGLSHAWWARGVYGSINSKIAESPSRAAARTALELDVDLAETYVVQADLKRLYDWDWTGSENSAKRALALDPNDVHAHYTYALLLCQLGRFPEAIAHMESADQLDPLAPAIQMNFARILYRARRFDDALRRLNRALELEPGMDVHILFAEIYEHMGLYAKALAAYQKADTPNPGDAWRVVQIYARSGRHEEARRMLEELSARKAPRAVVAAGAHAALGDKDEAFKLLFAMPRDEGFNYVKVDPPFDSLHSDPRWGELLHHMNLPVEGDADGAVSRQTPPVNR